MEASYVFIWQIILPACPLCHVLDHLNRSRSVRSIRPGAGSVGVPCSALHHPSLPSTRPAMPLCLVITMKVSHKACNCNIDGNSKASHNSHLINQQYVLFIQLHNMFDQRRCQLMAGLPCWRRLSAACDEDESILRSSVTIGLQADLPCYAECLSGPQDRTVLYGPAPPL